MIYLRSPLANGTPRLIVLFGILGWAILLVRLLPGSPSETIKDALRERDDRLHGEIWDLHYCMDGAGTSKAQISYPEPTLIQEYDTNRVTVRRKGIPHPESTDIRRSINQAEREKHLSDPHWKQMIVSIYDTLTTDTTILEVKPKFKYLPARGTILSGSAEGPYSPPGNTPAGRQIIGGCSAVIGLRVRFPDSLRIKIIQKKDTLPEHWITGIKRLTPKKEKPTNRTRVTVIFTPPNQYKVEVSQRPRQDLYTCSQDVFSNIDCLEDGWLELLWNGLIP
ncbi:MAG: hypothetical protein IPK50_08790 [Fibrobacterota bacterium]|nr:MAG: hypothetical protein IPK50_08790 [Fibrobacterota bacterium]